MNLFNVTWEEVARVIPHTVGLEVGRYVVTAGLASLVVWAFWNAGLKARKIQARTASGADLRREIATSLRSALVFAAVGFCMFLASRAGWLTIYDDFTIRGPAYFAVTLALMVVAHDAWYYWTHRAMHHPRLFRAFHRTHHRSKTPTPWTAYAFDVPEALVMVAFVPLWAAIVPMHDLAIYAFMTWQLARNVAGHTGVELSPVSGKPSRLFGWLNTSTHHDLHHQAPGSNFGLYFTWWDRLMGTEHPEYQARVAEIAERSRTNGKPEGVKVAVVLGLAVAGAGLAAGRAEAARADIAGRWATQGFGSIVEFRPCAGAPDTLCGRIVWLWKCDDPGGRRRTDTRNPDKALRSRPLVGIEIVRGLRETAPGVWSGGSIYNPDDGRTYTGTVKVRAGRLELKGCALNLLCQTQTWRRPEEVIAAVRAL
ncbi:MAG TPA: sterol desaturase family protein [Caulobacter sp.]|nr:sterol desaturase family protein [Caulobacter sp.]